MQILLRRIRTVHCLELVLYENVIQIVRQSLGIIGRPSLFTNCGFFYQQKMKFQSRLYGIRFLKKICQNVKKPTTSSHIQWLEARQDIWRKMYARF